VIGRLEATSYGDWGEIAYLLGEAWWGKGLAFEVMGWWHDYLTAASSVLFRRENNVHTCRLPRMNGSLIEGDRRNTQTPVEIAKAPTLFDCVTDKCHRVNQQWLPSLYQKLA
jgi:hypothetical protein